MGRVFQSSDSDFSGEISREEFLKMIHKDELRIPLEELGISTGEAEGLFTLLDADDSGTIDVDEFVNGCIRVTGGPKAVDLVTVLFEFRKLQKKVRDVQRHIWTLVQYHQNGVVIRKEVDDKGCASQLHTAPKKSFTEFMDGGGL